MTSSQISKSPKFKLLSAFTAAVLTAFAFSGCALTELDRIDPNQTSSTTTDPFIPDGVVVNPDDKNPIQAVNKLDFPKPSHMKWSPVWNPPTKDKIYQVVDKKNGYPEDGGTKYLLAHSCSLQPDCLGTAILDAKFAKGDTFKLDTAKYEVIEVFETEKTDLPDRLWEHEDGKVILITCVQDGTGYVTHNHIVIAELVG